MHTHCGPESDESTDHPENCDYMAKRVHEESWSQSETTNCPGAEAPYQAQPQPSRSCNTDNINVAVVLSPTYQLSTVQPQQPEPLPQSSNDTTLTITPSLGSFTVSQADRAGPLPHYNEIVQIATKEKLDDPSFNQQESLPTYEEAQKLLTRYAQSQ